MEMTRSMNKENGRKGVYFPPKPAFSIDKKYDLIKFPDLYLELACEQICFPPRTIASI